MAGLVASCGSEKTTEQKLAEVDQIFAEYSAFAMPGAAVMIIEDDVPILQKGYGIADFEQNLPWSFQGHCSSLFQYLVL